MMNMASRIVTASRLSSSPICGDVGLPFFPPKYGRAQDVVADVDAAGAVVVAGVVVVAVLVVAVEDPAGFGLAPPAGALAAFIHEYLLPSPAA
jgi:hypothetical protein